MAHRPKRKHDYWRVVIVYTDNETSSNRVFNDLARAKRWAARQEKSSVEKSVAWNRSSGSVSLARTKY
jgi:hypothetical protein